MVINHLCLDLLALYKRKNLIGKAMMLVFRSFYSWGRRLFFPDSYLALWSDEIPDRLQQNTVYIEGCSESPDFAAFVCPCGCSEKISLSLMKCSRCSWSISTDIIGRVSISPSVWRTKGCKSHFFLKNGKIKWVL